MTEKHWGPWRWHDGRRCPDIPIGTHVEAQGSEDKVEFQMSVPARRWKGWFRQYHATPTPMGDVWDTVIRYRIRRPKGLTILQRIAEQPEKERVEA